MNLAELVIIAILAFMLYQSLDKPKQVGGGKLSGNAPFSLVNEFVGQGIKGSYANMINGPDETKQILTPTQNPLPTFYGHSIPLLPQSPGKFIGQPITPHHKNPKCAPECCPSPYSCDKGCLCVDIDGLRL